MILSKQMTVLRTSLKFELLAAVFTVTIFCAPTLWAGQSFGLPSMNALSHQPTDLELSLGSSEGLDVSSFYKVAPPKQYDNALADRALGISMRSRMPVGGVQASFDYTLAALNEAPTLTWRRSSTFLADDNHLLQLRLDSQWQQVRYGLRYYSAGENFARQNLGRTLLQQAGLQGPAEGAEVWAMLKLAGISVRPNARRISRQQGATQHKDNQIGFTAEQNFLFNTRLIYQFQSSTSLIEQGKVSADRTNQSNSFSMHLHHPDWQLAWKSRVSEGFSGAAQRREENAQEVFATIRLISDLVVSPYLSRSLSSDGLASDRHAAAAALAIGYQPLDLRKTSFRLAVRYNEVRGVGENRTGVSADLGLRKSVRLPGLAAAQSSLGASLTYQRADDRMNGYARPKLGFMLTFQRAIGG